MFHVGLDTFSYYFLVNILFCLILQLFIHQQLTWPRDFAWSTWMLSLGTQAYLVLLSRLRPVLTCALKTRALTPGSCTKTATAVAASGVAATALEVGEVTLLAVIATEGRDCEQQQQQQRQQHPYMSSSSSQMLVMGHYRMFRMWCCSG